MTPTLPTDVSTLFNSLISELTLSTSQGGFGWNTSDVSAFITDITSSSVLLNDLSAMQLAGWIYMTDTNPQDDQPATDPYTVLNNQPPTTTLTTNYINGTVFPSFNKAANLTAVIAYEAGHAEDPQLNTIEYSGTDLQYGAWIALDLLSEGKALLNNEAVQQQLTGTNGGIPVIGLGSPTTVFAAAASEGIQGQSGIGYGLVIGYWDDFVTSELTKTGSLPSIESTCPPDIYNAFAGVNINLATNLAFAQPAPGTTSMVITFSTGSISSYEIDFGGYGDAAPSAPYFTAPSFATTSPAPPSLVTYQEFTFTNGDLLKEEYIFNSGTMIAGTQASETLIGAGTLAGLQAGGSLDTLIDISGTNSTFLDDGHKSLTEEALNGTGATKNVFKFTNGTNVLIGDLGQNTFVENLSATSATNIIYGGGGSSTYELSGVIDILYTQTVPTSYQLENLNLETLEATIPSGILNTSGQFPYGTKNVTYLIDPTSSDVMELPKYQPIYDPQDPTYIDSFGGTPTYASVTGPYSQARANGGSLFNFQKGNEINFTDTQIANTPTNASIISQVWMSGGEDQVWQENNYIVNNNQAGEFGEPDLKSNPQMFITLPKLEQAAALGISPAPVMVIVKPNSDGIAEPSAWAPNIVSNSFRLTAAQIGVLGADKIHTTVGASTIDLIASAAKWIPAITIQS